MHTRTKGAGSIYQRSSDGRWCASIDVGRPGSRRRRVITATTEAAVRERAAQLFPQDLPPVQSRAEMLADARTRGTHASAELRGKRTPTCVYCEVQLSLFNEVEDHIVPLAGEGSDAADNIQVICWQCNLEKGARATFEYQGIRPRPFAPHPKRRALWTTFNRRARMLGD